MNMTTNMSRGTMLQHNHLKWVEVLNYIVQTGDQLTYHEDTKVNDKVKIPIQGFILNISRSNGIIKIFFFQCNHRYFFHRLRLSSQMM